MAKIIYQIQHTKENKIEKITAKMEKKLYQLVKKAIYGKNNGTREKQN